MQIVDAQIHLWGSGLPSNLAHRQVTAFPTEEAVGLMDEGGIDAAVMAAAEVIMFMRFSFLGGLQREAGQGVRKSLQLRLVGWFAIGLPPPQFRQAMGDDARGPRFGEP